MSATPVAASGREAPGGAPNHYFRSLADAFEAASDHAGAIEHTLAIGPLRVAMRFAGPRLAELFAPAFEHLESSAAGGVDATVCVWDSESTGVRVPSFTWRPRHLSPRGE